MCARFELWSENCPLQPLRMSRIARIQGKEKDFKRSNCPIGMRSDTFCVGFFALPFVFHLSNSLFPTPLRVTPAACAQRWFWWRSQQLHCYALLPPLRHLRMPVRPASDATRQHSGGRPWAAGMRARPWHRSTRPLGAAPGGSGAGGCPETTATGGTASHASWDMSRTCGCGRGFWKGVRHIPTVDLERPQSMDCSGSVLCVCGPPPPICTLLSTES